jgi:hypothetical protein
MKEALREDFAKIPALLAEALPETDAHEPEPDPAAQLDFFG